MSSSRVLLGLGLALGLGVGAALVATHSATADAAAAENPQTKQNPADQKPAAEKPADTEKRPAEKVEIDARVSQGALRVRQPDGRVVECPLKHTDVKIDVSGFVARAKVTQTFHNPFKEKIEAVYVFPLPHLAAVDSMTMVVGERRIVGVIKRREEARSIYENALAQGQLAGLLEQERPNIFTQSVGNIAPGQEVRIEISYVDPLKYDQGVYELHFPMVVGPRYVPGSPSGTPSAGGFSPNTDRVPDASRITPPPLLPTERNGHDISLAVSLDAGVPIQDLKVPSHRAAIQQDGPTRATVQLSPEDSIPNKDFVLRYGVVGEKPEIAVLAHTAKPGDGYFMLMIQPKLDEELKKAPPRELTFLIDVSGSMSGQPTAKVQEAMRRFLELSKPDDRIQVVTFASRANQLFPKPVPATEENVATALAFSNATRGSGGTEMLKGVQMALADPVDPERVRIVVMLTDGFIGNEAEIIDEVGRRCGDAIRFWTIGIGSSPNRFLSDGVARQGGGMSAVLGLEDDPRELVSNVVERIHRAQLANIAIDWHELAVSDTYPAKVPELWAGRPVILFGRYAAGGSARIDIRGTVEGKPISYPVVVDLPANAPEHDVLATMWARQKIEDLSSQMYGGEVPALAEEVLGVALRYSIMSRYTSFVAIDETQLADTAEAPRPPRRVMVPVPLPEGVEWEGIFGSLGEGGAVDEGLVRKDQLSTSRLLGRAGALRNMRFRVPAIQLGVQPSTATPAAVRNGFLKRMREAEEARIANAPALGKQMEFAPTWSAILQRRTAGGIAGGNAGPRLFAGTEVRLQGQGRFGRGRGGPALADFSSLNEMIAGTVERGEMALPSLEALAAVAQACHEEAQRARKLADELLEKDNFLEARARLQHAYLLESAWLAVQPWNNDGTASVIAEELNDLQEKRMSKAVRERPALARRLELVLKHRSLDEALADLARAAEMEIELVPGSEDDAAALLGRSPQVVYLDLRGANVAQALSWLLEPMHLTWAVDASTGRVVVGTSRRLPGNAPWAYRVGDLLLPSTEEFGKDGEKALAAASKSVQDFLAAVRAVLGQKDEAAINPGTAAMITADQLLVYGDPDAHERVAALLAALTDADAPLAIPGYEPAKADLERLVALRATTAKRFAASRDAAQKRTDAFEQLRLLSFTRQYSWQLLSEAAASRLDPEALAWLETLWSSPRRAELLTGPAALVGYHSLWAIAESARAVPDQPSLRALAQSAWQAARPHLAELAKSLDEKKDDANLTAAALYAVLSADNATALRLVRQPDADAQGLAKLLRSSPLQPWTQLAAVLLDKADDAIAESLASGQLSGDDLIVLHALAARRLGAPAWPAFRAALPDLAAAVGDDHALLTINRLSTPHLPLAANR